MVTEPAREWTRISSLGTSDVWVQWADGFLIVAGDGFSRPDTERMVLLDARQAEQLAEFFAARKKEPA